MKKYFYMRNGKGLTNSGFSQRKELWILFDEKDVRRFEDNNITPYGTNKKGIFIEAK